ncbi:MAG: PIG-L family deacetylase [Ginsengibacter sp.]
MHKSFALSLLVLFSITALGQTPKSYSSSQIFQQIKKLNTLGSVLYIAAHPDDENTRLLAYLSNDKLYRTGYLSMTRGDGGQNLIGDEQGVELGLIRTQELLSARRIDGAEQFFTTAYDFGFTKSPVETFTFWNHQKVLGDVVWVIRKFQPDIIITRFPTTGEGGHGHHTASAILAGEAFDAAADPKQFPEQFKYGVKPWQAKRLLWNTFNFGTTNTTREDQFKTDVGGYNPLLGKSYGEIAAESRSQHKSQGFGVPASRGQSLEYFKTIKGSAPVKDLMDGVNTDWSRVNEANIQSQINKIKEEYSFQHPENSLSALLSVYKNLKSAGTNYYNTQKIEEIKDVIKECIGLYIETTSKEMYAVPGQTLNISVSVDKRLQGDVKIESVKIKNQVFNLNENLVSNTNFNKNFSVLIPSDATISQPYWLVNPMTKGNFIVNDQTLIGKAQNDPETAEVNFNFAGEKISYQIPLQYKSNDPVKGEEYQPIFIIPKVEIEADPLIALSVNNVPVKISTKTIHNDSSDSPLKIVYSNAENIIANNRGGYSIKNPAKQNAETMDWSATEGNVKFDSYKKLITYPHIPNIIYFAKATTRLIDVNLKIAGKKVGFIQGAGDKIPDALTKMGYDVTVLSKDDIVLNNLTQFDAIITGVRAYNIHEWLNEHYPVLMEYINQGGVLFVQYNTNNNIGPVKAKIGPYPFTISRNRVTDENAAVTFHDAQSPLLNYPNKITRDDFENWIQERSTYHAVDFEKNYQSLLDMHDEGEANQPGSLIYANYGKGRFIYSGLVFFRELPAGVPGAYRLFANLIAKPADTGK